MSRDLRDALDVLEKEKNISKDTLLEAIEQSLIQACKNHFGKADNVHVMIDPETCDFSVYADRTVVEHVEDPARVAQLVSERHFGIGSDGLILICPSEVADCRMRMFNEDGSEGSMCGNGIRCVGKYAYDHGIVDKPQISVETLGGIKYLDRSEEHTSELQSLV